MSKKISIRMEIIEKHRARLALIEKVNDKKLRPSEKLFAIYDGFYKENDTDQEQEDKGLSLKELYLILYYEGGIINEFRLRSLDDDGSATPEEFRKKLIEEQDYEDFYPLLRKTKKLLQRFKRSSYEKMQRAGDKSEVHHFNINFMRTRTGAYRFYNIIHEEDLEQISKHKAKIHLGIQKMINKFDDYFERKEQEAQRKERI